MRKSEAEQAKKEHVFKPLPNCAVLKRPAAVAKRPSGVEAQNMDDAAEEGTERAEGDEEEHVEEAEAVDEFSDSDDIGDGNAANQPA
eukprot:3734400-Pyramimonas_sp.AAC.1